MTKGPFSRSIMLSLGSIFLTPMLVSGQDTLEEIVITATKHEIELKQAPQPVNVIRKEDLERGGKRDTLRDLLLFEPGLLPTYHGGTDRRFTLRGVSPDKVLILKDGKRRESRPNKDFELDMLSLEDVERVEILKGPASVLYGSDAIGGVINIITREPLKPSFNYSVRYLRHESGENPETKMISFSAYTGRWHNFNLGFYGRYTKSDSYVQQKNFWELTPDREIRSGGLSLFYYFDKEAKNKLRFDYEKKEYDHLQIYPIMGRARKHFDHTQKENISLGYEGNIRDLKIKIRSYYTDFEMHVPRRALNNTLEDYDYGLRKTKVVEGSIAKTLFGYHRLTLGGEWRENEIEGTRLETDKLKGNIVYEGRTYRVYGEKIRYYAMYLQDEIFWKDKAFIVIGIRYDGANKLDEAFTPRLGATLNLSPTLRIKANYAKGFRNPGIEQLYYRIRVPSHWIWGNPGLKSEKSDGFDVAVEKDFGRRGVLKLNLFYMRADDLISTKFICRGDRNGTCRTRTGEIVPERVPYYEYVNLEEAKFQGLELGFAYRFSDKFSTRLAYTYLHAVDETTKNRLDQRARHRALTELVYRPLKSMDLSLNLEYAGDYLYGNENKNYFLVHVNFGYRFHRLFELVAGIENINDKKDLDLPILGRAYFLGVRGKF